MAPKPNTSNDPYAPPPMYHDRSGRLVRLALLALLVTGLGVGYFAWSASSPRMVAVAPVEDQQQLADAGAVARPGQIPRALPAAPIPPRTLVRAEQRGTPSARGSRRGSTLDSVSRPVGGEPATLAPIAPAASAPLQPEAAPPVQG